MRLKLQLVPGAETLRNKAPIQLSATLDGKPKVVCGWSSEAALLEELRYGFQIEFIDDEEAEQRLVSGLQR